MVSRYENEICIPTAEQINVLCELFNTSKEELFPSLFPVGARCVEPELLEGDDENYTFKEYASRDMWLLAREGIGASEAAAVMGMSSYKTNVQLWQEKVGLRVAEDISEERYVKYGTEAEAPLRELYKLDFPEHIVTHHPYRILRHKKYPFIFATLDGEILDLPSKKRGVYEGKTTEIMRSNQWNQWKDRIPQQYYVQVLHQLNVTGYDFAVLKAQIKQVIDGDVKAFIKHYPIERSAVIEEMEMLLEHEVKFWEHVESRAEPNLILPEI